MTRYLRLLAVFGLLQLCILGLLLALDSPRTYMASAADKGRLLATAPGPRIIMLGGSSAAFGVNSPLLERELGDRYQPINLGLNAGIGLDFMLNWVAASVRKGDVVVLSPEYEIVWSNEPTWYTLNEMLRFLPHAWDYMPEDERIWYAYRLLDWPVEIAHDVSVSTTNRLMPQPLNQQERTYSRDSLNRFGDNTSGWTLRPTYAGDSSPFAAPFSPDETELQIARLRGFAQWCSRKGATVAYAYPPLARDKYLANRADIERLAVILESELNVPFLDSPGDEVFDPTDFYDSFYHLRGSAAARRTTDLVRHLRDAHVVAMASAVVQPSEANQKLGLPVSSSGSK